MKYYVGIDLGTTTLQLLSGIQKYISKVAQAIQCAFGFTTLQLLSGIQKCISKVA